jgi:hypothetical protein
MGKLDAQRAMREASWAARNAAPKPAKAAAASAARASAPAAPAPAAPAPAAPATPLPDDDARCGHRSMNNRACTRERGHEATGTKNHRYA